MDRSHRTESPTTRRRFIHGAASAGLGITATCVGNAATARSLEPPVPDRPKGRVKQSIAFWCFNSAGDKWDVEKTCQVAKELGCVSVELIAPEHWGKLKLHGLVCAIASNGMPGAPFMRGFNNPKYHEEVIARTKATINLCADAGFPNVIAFTGYKWHDADDPKSGEISRDDGATNCVRALKAIVGHAEKHGVTICLEQLNTRDDSHPMKGHPGYQGDDIDYVADIVRRVGSPRLKLLFDIYHVQIMNGDVIRRIDRYRELIGHVHTAGNPGRGELDDTQEIQYAPIMRKLVEIGYTGYVGQEFIPTRNPLESLRQAVRLCDV
jgi:hydroxypyruvate isomerase